jgi:hypothetical protein
LVFNFLASEESDLGKLYYDAKFAEIIRLSEKEDYLSLSLKDKLIYIESLARSGKNESAERKINQILQNSPQSSDILSVRAIIALSKGRFSESEQYINKALALNSDSLKAQLCKVMLLLFKREFEKASALFITISEKSEFWKKSNLLYLVGIEVFNAAGHTKRLSNLYKFHLNTTEEKSKNYKKELKAKYRFYKKLEKKQLFSLDSPLKEVSVPLKDQTLYYRHKVLLIESKNQDYKVVLDTGNSTGWFIHNRDLKKNVMSRQGGKVYTMIGSEAGYFDGYQIISNVINFKNFKLLNVAGVYVPKPNRDFYDANLNPLFIRDYVVTLDLINNRFTLHTAEEYANHLSTLLDEDYLKLKWFGYENAYVPVSVLGRKGLAMIETGAEDVAINLNFARKLNIRLNPKTRYLANGKKYQYYKTAPIDISIGKWSIKRESAEAWPLDRFFKRVSGLTPDIILGPKVFEGKYSVSFNPSSNEVILVRRR